MIKIYQNFFSNFLMKIIGYDAITLGHKIYFKKDKLSVPLLAHELVHVKQVDRMGFWSFAVSYIFKHFRLGHTLNPFEIQAQAEASFNEYQASVMIGEFYGRKGEEGKLEESKKLQAGILELHRSTFLANFRPNRRS